MCRRLMKILNVGMSWLSIIAATTILLEGTGSSCALEE